MLDAWRTCYTLFFRFSGGGNPKYTILVLKVLQGL